jgi:lysozyme family protein
MTFDEAFERVIGHEGGYVNDPRDPGGETNWGISKRAYPNVDIRNLSKDAAKEIYFRDYWQRARCNEYDGAIGFQLFDCAVNTGIGQAIRFLQRAAGVVDDGVVGVMTVAAIRSKNAAAICAKFNAERLEFYTRLSTWSVYGAGWARRVANNLRYEATDTGDA